MESNIERGEIVFRQWDEFSGLKEFSQTFNSLDELFHLCLSNSDPLLVDRVTIRGFDEDGNRRQLTLVFQSITVSGSTDDD
jgi:hypothetical protein